MKHRILAALSASVIWTSGAQAQDSWPPFELALGMSKDAVRIQYEPFPAASKQWSLCALVPHMKDSYWVAAGYGLAAEAERLDLKLTILQAGGYDQLPKQIAQFDDCLAAKADAILIAPISEAGLAPKIAEARERGIVTIGLLNPITEGTVDSRVTIDQFEMGRMGGETVKAALGEEGGDVAAFPGPQGSGWAEAFLNGFKAGIEGSKVNLVAEKFGDTGVAVQLRLVEDTLQTFPDLDAIWGSGPTAEAAAGAVAEAGLNIKIISSYADQSSLNLLRKGRIESFLSDSTAMQGRVAVDQAVKVLEKQPFEATLVSPPVVIDAQNLSSIAVDSFMAPDGWTPVFSVN